MPIPQTAHNYLPAAVAAQTVVSNLRKRLLKMQDLKISVKQRSEFPVSNKQYPVMVLQGNLC